MAETQEEASMSRLSDFALRHVLPILERIAPHWTE